MNHQTIRVESSEGGRVRTITLDRPKGNVITIAMCDEVRRELALIADDTIVSLVIVRGEGSHFSFGASVQEHLPETAERMLAALDGVILDLVALNVPTLAAVEGRCLGGGLEVALACGFVFVAEDALLGCPEIQLGVFAPAATALLARCLPRARFEELLLTGRTFTGAEAVTWGLANRLVPCGAGAMGAAIKEFLTTLILPRSTPSLRVACVAADWRIEPVAGTPGSLNPGQAGLIIFNAKSIVADPAINQTTAYSSVHDPLASDLTFGAIADTSITVNVAAPPNSTADNTGIQVEWFLDANSNGLLDGGESSAVHAPWMSPDEGGAYLDPTMWSNTYSHAHTGLAAATQYCYRFRYRNGDGLVAGVGDITPFSVWNCAVTTSSCSLGSYLCGDCNGNGFNEITDSLLMAQMAAGLAVAPAYGTDQFNACNVHGAVPSAGGATIGVIDALWNAKFVVGLVTLSCCVP